MFSRCQERFLEKRSWVIEQLPFWASPVTAGDFFYCVDSSGTTMVLAAGPECKLISINRINETTWSSPAVAECKLYLRTNENLYCIGEEAKK